MVAPNYDGSNGFGGAFFGNYKQIYGPKNVKTLVYRNKRFLEKLKKVDDFEGTNYAHTLIFEDPMVGSATFLNAQNNANQSSQTKRMSIWRGRMYGSINFDAEEAAASRSDAGSLLRKKSYETNRVLFHMGAKINEAVHGNGTGIIGSFTTGASLAAGNNQGAQANIVLDNPKSIIRFGVGQQLQLATNNPGDGTPPTLGNGGSIVTVTARPMINANSGVITVSANLNAWLPALATSTTYYLLGAGDGVGFGMNVNNGGVSGLKAWLPTPVYNGVRVPSNDSFWGCNRSTDERRLAGIPYAAAPAEKMNVTFENAGAELNLHTGGGNYMCLVSPSDLSKFSLDRDQYRRIIDDGGDRQVGATGFNPLKIRTQAGVMELEADPEIDPGTFYFIDMDDAYLKTLGAVPHLDDFDGNTALRLANADAANIRWRAWYQFILNEPGRHLVGTFA